MSISSADTVIPARIDKGNLIPKNYTGTLRTFLLLSPKHVPLASGAAFSDGRIVVMSADGQTMSRYTGKAPLMAQWWGLGKLLWRTDQTGPEFVWPRRFLYERAEDETGTSGEGIATEGVVFPHGAVVLMWLGAVRSIVEWGSMEEALAINGHEGRTQVKWLDPA